MLEVLPDDMNTEMKKAEKIDAKKLSIIKALERRLERDVYSRITVQDIADEAGFSKGGLLYYYPTKETIYLDLMQTLFEEIERDLLSVISGNLLSQEKAGISALYGIEKFVLTSKNTRIFINLVLYGYEDEQIMKPLREFIQKHLAIYQNIIEESRTEAPSRRRGTGYDPRFMARIAQLILFSAGFFESIDPIGLDPMSLVRYTNSILKG